jgi:flagellar hook assembly protein FlgD
MEKLEQLYSSQNISDEKLNTKTVALTEAWLEQNIPNPFEQSTTIRYFLPENSGDARINIYSERGELIKSISVTEKGEMILTAADLASGAYQYALVVNGRVVSSKQMIHTK